MTFKLPKGFPNFQKLFGSVESMNRADLNWLITIPSNGSLPFDGVCHSLIQWPNELHPSSKLSNSSCSLIKIEGYHNNAKQIEGFNKNL